MKLSKKQLLKYAVLAAPLILGAAGLLSSGMRIQDALFNSVLMYFMNYGDEAPNAAVEIARWAAPVMTASSLFTLIRNAWNELRSRRQLMSEDIIALYCNEEKKEEYLKAFPHAVYCGDAPQKEAKRHLLMLDTDRENLALAAALTDGEVYIELKETNSFLMKSTDRRFFNINELIARGYWKKFDLLDENISDCRIAVVGTGSLGMKMLKFGLMNNIYDLNQQIAYHIYGAKPTAFTEPETGNADKILFHNEIDDSIFACSRVIFTEEPDISLLEELLYRNPTAKIFYHAAEPYLESIYESPNIICYGSDVLSESAIMTSALYRGAMLMNYNYKCLYEGCDPAAHDRDALAERYYNELSGFFKGSNFAACDYNAIRVKLLARDGNPEIVQDDKYVRMEHLRWCRYYWVNHWTYGKPKNKQERNALRIHPCLTEYDNLTREDKDKDLETIRVAMKSTEE